MSQEILEASGLFDEESLLEQEILSSKPSREDRVGESKPRTKNVAIINVATSKYPNEITYLFGKTKEILAKESLRFPVELTNGYDIPVTEKSIPFGIAHIDEAISGKKYFKMFVPYKIVGTNLKLYTVVVDDGINKIPVSVRLTSMVIEKVAFASAIRNNLEFRDVYPKIWDKYYIKLLQEIKKEIGE